MDEQYLQDLLSAYLDNELTAEQKAAVDEYLAANPEAREQLARLERLNRLVEDHSGLDGEDYWEESASKIERQLGISGTQVTALEPERRKRTGLWWKLTSIAASVAILVFVGLHQTDIMGPDQSKETVALAPAPVSTLPADVRADSTVIESGDIQTPPGSVAEPSDQAQSNQSQTEQTPIVMSAPKQDLQSGLTASVDKPEQVDGQEAKLDLNYKSESESKDTRAADTRGSAPVSAGEVSPPPRQTAAAMPAEAPPENGGDEEMRKVAVDERKVSKIGAALPRQVGSDKSKELDQSLVSRESELARCRKVRDSLTEQLAALDDSKGKRHSRAVGAVTPQSLSAQSETASVDRRAELESRLAEIWLSILVLGTDSTETVKGMEYLRRVAADSLSPNREKAADCLERIRRNEGPAAFE